MPLGINLTLLIGASVPRPAPRSLMETLKTVEVTQNEEGRSGFQIGLQLGRSGKKDLKDDQLLQNPLLKVFNRVILIVTLGARAEVLIDGIITNHQVTPSLEPGQSTFTLTGEDVSVMMDLEEKSVEHVAQDEATIVRLLIASYAKYGLIPKITKPPLNERPTKNERIPSQQGTDLNYLQTLAQRFAYVFYIKPGPGMGSNIAYWGPPQQKLRPQKPLTVNMGAFSNVTSINFQYNALSITEVKGSVQDRKTNQIKRVQQSKSDRPSLSKRPALQAQSHRRITQLRETGRDTAQAGAIAQATINQPLDSVITASGELDTIRYGALLKLREVVSLRGVGYNYDGLYYVKSVTHKISQGDYKQSFSLSREGLETTIQRVTL